MEGLAAKDVWKLKEKYGDNVLPEKENFSWLGILLSQLKNPLIYILLFAGTVSLVFQQFTDLLLILVVILFDVLMGFYQEYTTHKTLSALKKILKPRVLVIRGEKRIKIEARDLVPGDLVVLSAGDQIPADGKLFEGAGLLISESILTGEEEAVYKKVGAPLFMGTIINSGTGIMLVDKIGTLTEIGKIGKSLAEIKDEKTVLQKRLEKFSGNLAYLVGIVCIFIFFTGIYHRIDILMMLKLSVVLSVAAIPEGLPLAVTVILSLGMRRILKKNGLVKKLLSVETLGSTSVICTDKTGTLTQGIMQVVKAELKETQKTILALGLSNNQKSSLEICLWEYIKKQEPYKVEKILNSAPKIYEEPFDSERKYNLTICYLMDKPTAFIRGAPEIVLSFCDLNQKEKEKILKKIDDWASDGLKVVGAAYKVDRALKIKRGYQWLGLVGIEDPLRPEVIEAVSACQKLGIKVKIVTGDYRQTAEKVASNLGLHVGPNNVLEGEQLEKISDDKLTKIVSEVVLFTRVTPLQKVRIVEALQKNGEVVAMTGDGVNDALALRKANIGVVVENASEVAKEASDLVLLDSNFRTIVAACEEGRLIFSNIKKVVVYVLSNSFAEICLILGAILMELSAPITVVQILWIHLICDGPPDILLGFEPKEKSLTEITPQEIQQEDILDRSTKLLVLVISLTVGLLSLTYFWFFSTQIGNLKLAQTITFASLATSSLVYIFAFKSLRSTIFNGSGFFQNKFLFLGVAYGFGLVFAAIYFPALNNLLGTVPLNPIYWVFILSVGLVAGLWVELVKIFNLR